MICRVFESRSSLSLCVTLLCLTCLILNLLMLTLCPSLVSASAKCSRTHRKALEN